MKPYRDYADFLAEHFDCKIQKIAVNAGFSCPNRDGTVGYGGCTYCNNQSFTPGYCRPAESVTEQLEKGKTFFARKYPRMRFLAYFQAYTSTHADTPHILAMLREALAVEDIAGLVIATRPDCMPPDLLAELHRLHEEEGVFIIIEYGAETSHAATLELINRCHTWQQTVEAVNITAEAGLLVGLHLINGLPGETDDMILATVDRVNGLPVSTIKFHQLQLIRSTRMEREVSAGLYDIRRWNADQYIELCCRIVRRLRPDIAIERFVSQGPEHLIVYPHWGLKNYQFTNLLHNRLASDSL